MTTSSPSIPRGDLGIVSAVLMTLVGGYIDAFLFLRHHVFGFAQTGNVIFLAVAVVQGEAWLTFLWPLLAYIAGLSVAQLLRAVAPTLPTRVTGAALSLQLVVFAALAVLPRNAPSAAFVVPLSFIGGVRLELFRSAAGISFVSIATTGNLMRFVASTAEYLQNRSRANQRAVAYTAVVVLGFIAGALCGAYASQTFSPALWGAVILEAASLAVFIYTSRRPRLGPASADDRQRAAATGTELAEQTDETS